MDERKIYAMLGLCKKAGKVVSGSVSVEKSVKTHRAKLVIIAKDASERTKKDIAHMCDFNKTEYVIFGAKEMLGSAIGFGYRVQLAVTDENFAARIGSMVKDAL